MYAIIKTGGKQYRVAEGDVITIEKLEAAANDSVTFEEVLTVVNENTSLLSNSLNSVSRPEHRSGV